MINDDREHFFTGVRFPQHFTEGDDRLHFLFALFLTGDVEITPSNLKMAVGQGIGVDLVPHPE